MTVYLALKSVVGTDDLIGIYSSLELAEAAVLKEVDTEEPGDYILVLEIDKAIDQQ